MKSFIIYTSILLAVALGPAQAENVEAGKKLVDANCNHCHGSEVYTRSDRRVGSLPQLRNQVQRCELALGLKWFDDEIDNASAYLNHQFYKFE